ncbi:baseplate J/gp47 family protein [Pasteurella skyensis]|uniref:Baseplate J/gp47 family protein n=1 Tax=Phocoenobacter skyensis TaxID=97481 RepID=A0AAJ6NAC0_9PAST|nr:baseplate J/gp47 family protein [Pasteurella skyensis]MDP8173131.1 baseplate J/gp47 family protein [Pasteurella skyensis]MDP8178936.1 baseplate J/gp47 family protein [Pasteurella skyensis]
MSRLVDLSKLPAPNILEPLDFEQLLAERKESFIALFSQDEQEYWRYRLQFESDPVTKLLEENAYLQMLEIERINNAAKATMLAYSTGSNLDVVSGNYNVQRKVIDQANDSVSPPFKKVLESDTDLRLRTQLAFEGMSVAGPRNAYLFHALSAHHQVADVSVQSPNPAEVLISVLSTEENGIANNEILKAVEKALNDDDIRPVGDRLIVQSAEIVNYQIQATIYLYQSPDGEIVKNQAIQSLQRFVKERRRIGRDISLSGIYASLQVEGVQRVVLTNPTQDLVLTPSQAGYCTEININTAISDDY